MIFLSLLIFSLKYLNRSNANHSQSHMVTSNPNQYSKNGEWKKQDIIIEADDQSPKKVCVSIWGDKINECQLQIDKILKIDFDIESRDYNTKWYTAIKTWKIEVAGTSTHNIPYNTDNFIKNSEDDILPF